MRHLVNFDKQKKNKKKASKSQIDTWPEAIFLTQFKDSKWDDSMIAKLSQQKSLSLFLQLAPAG